MLISRSALRRAPCWGYLLYGVQWTLKLKVVLACSWQWTQLTCMIKPSRSKGTAVKTSAWTPSPWCARVPYIPSCLHSNDINPTLSSQGALSIHMQFAGCSLIQIIPSLAGCSVTSGGAVVKFRCTSGAGQRGDGGSSGGGTSGLSPGDVGCRRDRRRRSGGHAPQGHIHWQVARRNSLSLQAFQGLVYPTS